MKKYVVGIGAANIDIYAKSKVKYRPNFDHPSNVITTVGGVTRNILENITKLGEKTVLLSAVGNDVYGQLVLNECKKVGIDVKHVLKVKNVNTGMFIQVKDNRNDMHMALCDMDIIKYINKDYIDRNDKVIANSSAIVLDPSLDNSVIEYIIDKYSNIKIFVDPISEYYAKKIRPYMDKIYCIKPNKKELAALTSCKIVNNDSLIKAYSKISKVIPKVYVSIGKDGVIYRNNEGKIKTRKFNEIRKMVNASGAGDAMLGVLIYSYLNDLEIEKTIDYALAAGIATVNSEYTINPKLSIKLLKKIIKENRNEL